MPRFRFYLVRPREVLLDSVDFSGEVANIVRDAGAKYIADRYPSRENLRLEVTARTTIHETIPQPCGILEVDAIDQRTAQNDADEKIRQHYPAEWTVAVDRIETDTP